MNFPHQYMEEDDLIKLRFVLKMLIMQLSGKVEKAIKVHKFIRVLRYQPLYDGHVLMTLRFLLRKNIIRSNAQLEIASDFSTLSTIIINKYLLEHVLESLTNVT